MRDKKGFIGVFDSGVGGITILRAMTGLLPKETFVYFGDSANMPYGEKGDAWLRERSLAITKDLLADGAKAIVIACNTATAAAAKTIRETYPDIPVIGVEPALKTAADAAVPGTKKPVYLVMATPVTLSLEKYHALEARLLEKADFIPLACDGLAAMIDRGILSGPEMREYLQKILSPYIKKVDGVVLGCTHYPLIRSEIRKVIGNLPMYDGADGTARELRRRLAEEDLLNTDGQGSVTFRSSIEGSRILDAYQAFYRLAGDVS